MIYNTIINQIMQIYFQGRKKKFVDPALNRYDEVLTCWYIQYATPIMIRTMIIPTITGARTFTKKISIAIMTIAAIIVTIIEPALLAIIVCILQNINR